MKRILVAVVAGVGLIASAGAEAQQAWWGGPEVGVQGGYGWGTTSGHVGGAPFHDSTSGGIGGLNAGYNWQMGHFVIGIQGLAEGGRISGSGTVAGTLDTAHSNVDWDGVVRGKVGYAFDRTLIYGTGGMAAGQVRTSYALPGLLANDHDTLVGWTAGAGVAYKITPTWDVNAEYRYTDLGSNDFTVGSGAGATRISDPVRYSLVTVGLTWMPLPPAPPPPPMVTPIPAAAPAAAPPPLARTFLVFFDFDKYNLTPDARQVIEAAASSYRATGAARLEVSGYTDLAGTQAYNMRLSQRRADAVSNYLLRHGVPKNVMDVKWFGKEHPRVPTPDGVREPQNRRVEIVMP